MNTNPSRNPGRTFPVDSVSWSDAQEFCMRLSWLLGVKVRLPTGNEFRVALGGEGAGELWSSGNSEGHSHEVGVQKPNKAGFADLLGNLAEWADTSAEADKAPVMGGSYLDAESTLVKVPTEQRLKSDRARHVGLRILLEL
jgi:formylglycine-generating enzyme required for sulfatase activity